MFATVCYPSNKEVSIHHTHTQYEKRNETAQRPMSCSREHLYDLLYPLATNVIFHVKSKRPPARNPNSM